MDAKTRLIVRRALANDASNKDWAHLLGLGLAVILSDKRPVLTLPARDEYFKDLRPATQPERDGRGK